MRSYETAPRIETTPNGLHPAPRKHGVNLPNLPPLSWGADGAQRAVQRLLRLLDTHAAEMGYEGRLHALEIATESLGELAPEHYSTAYLDAYKRALSAARVTLEHAELERRRRLDEAEQMRERGRREMARYEREAVRLEGYAAKYENVRLSDARFRG